MLFWGEENLLIFSPPQKTKSHSKLVLEHSLRSLLVVKEGLVCVGWSSVVSSFHPCVLPVQTHSRSGLDEKAYAPVQEID